MCKLVIQTPDTPSLKRLIKAVGLRRAKTHCGAPCDEILKKFWSTYSFCRNDKIDDLHFYTLNIKYGIGRATYDASQEIRNKHINREEGQALVNRYDGEFPDRYFDEIMEYIDMKPERFHDLCDEFRSPHLWNKVDGKWKLRHNVNQSGISD